MMQTNNTMKAFLSLVCLGIGHKVVEPIERADWSALRALADEQGLSAIVLDGVEKLPERLRPKQEVLLKWIGEVLLSYENRYKKDRGDRSASRGGVRVQVELLSSACL